MTAERAHPWIERIAGMTAPWRWARLEPCGVPGMITGEECKYYRWLARRFAGRGQIVELGAWLGRSTLYIVNGLKRSRGFPSHKLFVFDDFIWRSSWMNTYYPGPAPRNHSCFRSLFDNYTSAIREHLLVRQRSIYPYDGNEGVPSLSWSDGEIELLFVDCGRTLEANEAWFATLSPFFMPGTTLLVMQDWQTHKEQPPKSYNQTKVFTDGKGQALDLVHELRQGTVATFLYKGSPL